MLTEPAAPRKEAKIIRGAWRGYQFLRLRRLRSHDLSRQASQVQSLRFLFPRLTRARILATLKACLAQFLVSVDKSGSVD
jgi:hypothetical protein